MTAIRYVTGVNAEYFFILFPLFASFRRHAPDIRVEVCDFGLTEAQRSFLDRKGLLVKAPADLGRLPKAPPLLRQAIQSDPEYREAYVYLAMMLRRLGEHAAADEILARARAKWPEDPALRQTVGH